MLTSLVFLLALILLNGLLALSEISVVSSRRARLQQMADRGSTGATRALALSSEPTRFLSTVQVGITCIGILSGAIGEKAIVATLRPVIERVPFFVPYSEAIAVAIMVVGITYLSLILGELVPKRVALTRPETFASVIARPMQILARAAQPIIYIASKSTDAVLRIFGVNPAAQPAVSVEEIKVLLREGAEEGVVEAAEREMMTNVLDLDERAVASVLTPRSDVTFLDLGDTDAQTREKLHNIPHPMLPVCDGGLDHAIGIVRTTRVLQHMLEGRGVDLRSLAERPLFVPETMSLMKLLEHFKSTHLTIALVVDEFGEVTGLVSLTDVVSSIVGDLPGEPGDEPMIVRRQDGSWLLDGALDRESLARVLGHFSFFDDERKPYHTLGGLVMDVIGRIPRTGDTFTLGPFRFEVVDMDGHRVDRVMVSNT